MNLKWADFLDKVYGCWIGKCVSGTIGAPYEGYKGIMNVEYTPKLFEKVIPNDDLDLQVMWLEVVEKVGVNFTAQDLAKAFYEKYPPSPGEYAIFKKNYEMGLTPPLTGKFNNNYYIEGMGCPIRSEIWACLAPGDAELAVELAGRDGCMDHYGESIIAEKYLAALEALAFTDKWDVKGLIVKALDYIDETSRVYEMIGKILSWCEGTDDWKYVLGLILRDYGHPDCTNMYQNIGITIMALLLGKGDFIKTTMLALNCGFDTDCTCATVGAIIGITEGGKALMKKYRLGEQTYKLDALVVRRSDRVYDLAEDTACAALMFLDRNKKVNIKDYPENLLPVLENRPSFPIRFQVQYEKDYPAIAPGETKEITIRLDPTMKIKTAGTIKFRAPEGFTVKPEECKFKIGFFNSDVDITVSVAKDIPVLMQKNLITYTVTLENGDTFTDRFGLVGAQLYKVYGPFWENVTYAPPPKALESYYSYVSHGENPSESLTNVRQFHINMKADWKKEYLEDQLLGNKSLPASLESDPAYQGFPVAIYEDKFSFSDLMTNKMPCVVYMVRDVYAPEDMTVCMQVGHSDVFRLWKDGDLLAYSDITENWTPENIHKLDITLHKGLNRFVVKLARTNGTTDFSIMFTEKGACTKMISSLGSGKM